MIISEKQIMMLIKIARDSMRLAVHHGEDWEEYAMATAKFLDVIIKQQSVELKVIE